MHRSLTALALAFCPLAAASSDPVGGRLPFEDIASGWLRAHGYSEGTPPALETLLERHFVRARLGVFDVGVPLESLADKAHGRRFRDVCAALVEAQEGWAELLDPAGRETREVRKDLTVVRKWVEGWNPTALTKLADDDERSVAAALAPRKAIAEAAARLQTTAPAALAPAGAGEEGAPASPLSLVLAPTRGDFVRLLSVAGVADPTAKDALWVDGAEGWLHFRAGPVEVYSGALAAPGAAAGDWEASLPMDDENPSALAEQVVQLSLTRLAREGLGDGVPPQLAAGLAMNLVIDAFGELDTRIDGDLSSNETRAREVFVRGGMSEGGRLPQNVADSAWREGLGKDRYRRVLRQAQKAAAGGREGPKNKLARFQLRSRDQTETSVAGAPLLGAGGTSEVPEAVQGEFSELLRAYRCAFTAWLREKGAGSKQRSAEALSSLLEHLADPSRESGIEEAFEAAYGLPLSDPECTTRSLEGRFLVWVSRG